jgi:hypothetical protein
MMKYLRVSGVPLELNDDEALLSQITASSLGIPPEKILSLEILRKAIDARRHKPPHFVYILKVGVPPDIYLPGSLEANLHCEEIIREEKPLSLIKVQMPKRPVIVVGAGPAGLFAAYVLVQSGVPTILLERGGPVEQRTRDVEKFWQKGILNPESNVLFGEGGAGTFSDGKLTNRTNSPDAVLVKKVLVEMGAQSDILTDAKPHIGTDRLRDVILNLRKNLIERGCQIHFESLVTDFLIKDGRLTAIIVNGKTQIEADWLILAIGQNADDTYHKLFDRGVPMQAKPFAMGLRVEHPQSLINAVQYGQWLNHPQLPPAEYFIKATLPDEKRSVYTFCMCPGGSVIGCSEAFESLVTNGMSNSKRSGGFANAAVVANVRVDDFAPDDYPLHGLTFRKFWEKKAFYAGGGDYKAPAQKLTDFLKGKTGSVPRKTSFLPGVTAASMDGILPDFIAVALKAGMKEFDKKMRGFVTEEATLMGVETRTSSPVRICRRSDGQSETLTGIYPCGEGAGYAGGIISSAVDGIKAARHLISHLK